jgi:hypothetical protein
MRTSFKKIKLFYHLSGLYRILLPGFLFRRKLAKFIEDVPEQQIAYIQKRVDYYNKLTGNHSVSSNAVLLKDFKFSKYSSAYYHDAFEYVRFFNTQLRADFLFGDITFIPEFPSILKSRPISDKNQNSVLLNLDKFRHFNFINDKKPFGQKKDELVWRGHISVQKMERIEFLKKYFNHSLCNIGNTNNWKETQEWQRERMTIEEQLEYKFILCLEGVDVATNLKWVMSSNSLAVMPKPKFETWFMEGTLKPDYHYVLIKDDFSDLIDKLSYYSQHRDEAELIIKNAHEYVDQFRDKKKEKIISLKVLYKYFENTDQL